MINNNSLSAWLAKAEDGQIIAFAAPSLREFLAEVQLVAVPTAPSCCSYVMEWKRELVPIFRARTGELRKPPVLLLVTGKETGVSMIGLVVTEPPRRVSIEDAWSEHFDESRCGIWKRALMSGFVYQDQHIPIIHPDLMCDTAFIRSANSAAYKPGWPTAERC